MAGANKKLHSSLQIFTEHCDNNYRYGLLSLRNSSTFLSLNSYFLGSAHQANKSVKLTKWNNVNWLMFPSASFSVVSVATLSVPRIHGVEWY